MAAGVRPAISLAGDGKIKADRFIETGVYMQTTAADVYAAGDVTGRSGIWPNAMKQGETAAYNMCGQPIQYLDTYAMKNTMNFYGLTTLSLGRGVAEEGDEVLVREDREITGKRFCGTEGWTVFCSRVTSITPGSTSISLRTRWI